MDTKRGNLVATHLGGDIEIGNDRARARFVPRDGGYAQQFFAADRKGQFHLLLSSLHKSLIPSSEHRSCSSPMISGERPHLFAVCRESLRMVYSSVEIVRHDERMVVAKLAGSAFGHSLKCWVIIRDGSNAPRVVVRDDIERNGHDPLIEYLMSSYAFIPDGRELSVGEQLDYSWAPSLRPEDDQVIGDCAFYSPAAIVQHGRLSAVLVPDLNILDGNRPMPAALDLDLTNGLLPAPLLSYGFCGYELTPNGSHCRHDITMARRLPGSRLVYGYHLVLDADSKPRSSHREASRFLWATYGSGGARHSGNGALVRSSAIRVEPSIPPDAWAACGLYARGIKTDDADLLFCARAAKNAVLSSPQRKGLFPTRFDSSRSEWAGCEISVDGACYHTVECSRQLLWLLRWHREIESDPRIIDFCRNYADFIIASRMRNGAIPSWYAKNLTPLSTLRSSAQTAATALLLAELATITGLDEYARAAEQSGRFVLEEVVAKGAFKDYTLIRSAAGCADLPDSHSGADAQGAMAILWTAQLCLALHKLTGNPDYLERGPETFDLMCLFQSVRSTPWADASAGAGLCSLGNTRHDFDVELAAEFAACAMDYGAITGNKQYFERGVAALSAAVAYPSANALARARTAAIAACVESAYGAAYVHVGRKWAVQITREIGQVDFGSGLVSLKAEVSANGNRKERVVFGGLRSDSCRVTINEWHGTPSRAEMESGIPIQRSAPERRAKRTPVRQSRQLRLEALLP